MKEIYNNILSAIEIQLSTYVVTEKVLYSVYYNYNPLEMTEEQAIGELQKLFDAFVIPE